MRGLIFLDTRRQGGRKGEEMKTVGIVAEYNPYHKGHKYHLERTLEMTDPDCVVSVMSGDFTQRGEISPWNKWFRSKMAVIAGVDLVVELPFVYAVNRGEMFAKGAVDILAKMGVDYISFGSESGDIDELVQLAEDIEGAEDRIAAIQAELMKTGDSYARCRTAAISRVLDRDVSDLIRKQNNFLGLEYIKRTNYWKKLGVHIEPVTVKRKGSGYFEINDELGYAGASQIRDAMADGDRDTVALFVPEEVQFLIDKCLHLGPAESKMLDIVHVDILRKTPEQLAEIYCMGEGLENKLKKEIRTHLTIQSLVDSLTSKRYTSSAMRRLLLYLLMDLKGKELPEASYARVLAADRLGRDFLRKIKDEDRLPVITNVNKEMPEDEAVRRCLDIDMKAADIYNYLTGGDEYADSDRVVKPFII